MSIEYVQSVALASKLDDLTKDQHDGKVVVDLQDLCAAVAILMGAEEMQHDHHRVYWLEKQFKAGVISISLSINGVTRGAGNTVRESIDDAIAKAV